MKRKQPFTFVNDYLFTRKVNQRRIDKLNRIKALQRKVIICLIGVAIVSASVYTGFSLPIYIWN